MLSLFVSLLTASSVYTQGPGSFLGEHIIRHDQLQSVLEHQPVNYPSCRQKPTGPIEATTCDYETLESVSDGLYSKLEELVHKPFFKFFRADLYRDCPFWQENSFCMNRDCGVETIEETDIPERWRASTLSKVEAPGPDVIKSLPGCYYRDADFCFTDDSSEGDYIDLTQNPERFTGYSGDSAHRVWSAIYDENCFGLSERSQSILGEPAAEEVDCFEKKVYYRIISGLHASISTHICWDMMDQRTGKWGPDLHCFIKRVAAYPERLKYIYFNTVLLLRAVARLGPYLSAYDYCSGGVEDGSALRILKHVISTAQTVGSFDETQLFKGEDAKVLKEEFKDHFRNVSRIMDCVGCDKCRLWGKVQTTGIGTALKVLFELDEKALDPAVNHNLLHRSEVVALINTLHRFVESLHAVNTFRSMWAELEEGNATELIRDSEQVHLGNTIGTPRNSSPLSYLREAKDRVVDLCRQGTDACLELLSGVSSIFTLSGKDEIPHPEL